MTAADRRGLTELAPLSVGAARTALQNGADLLWIETEKPHIEQIAGMVDRIREVVPNAKLAYNNSPSFNWTLNFRQQVFDAWQAAGKDVSGYDRARLMSVDYDGTELAADAIISCTGYQSMNETVAAIVSREVDPTESAVVTVGEFGEPEQSEVVTSVAQAFLGTRLGCAKCHNLDSVAQDAPSLSNARNRFNPEWLGRWLLTPTDMRADATMPQLTPAEMDFVGLKAAAAREIACCGIEASDSRPWVVPNRIFNDRFDDLLRRHGTRQHIPPQ